MRHNLDIVVKRDTKSIPFILNNFSHFLKMVKRIRKRTYYFQHIKQ